MDPLPSDDRAPEPTVGGRRLPRGLWFAVALAIVVLAIAAFQATGSPPSTSAGDDVTVLDPSLTTPADGANPLATTGSNLVGQPAPTTQLTRFDGSPASLADYRDRPLVVNFWATSCTPCRAEMPALEQVHQQFGDRVAFVGVDSGESIAVGRPFADQAGITYDLLSDPQSRMISDVRSGVLPTTVLVRRDGTIARIRAGAVTAEQLQGWIEQDLLS